MKQTFIVNKRIYHPNFGFHYLNLQHDLLLLYHPNRGDWISFRHLAVFVIALSSLHYLKSAPTHDHTYLHLPVAVLYAFLLEIPNFLTFERIHSNQSI